MDVVARERRYRRRRHRADKDRDQRRQAPPRASPRRKPGRYEHGDQPPANDKHPQHEQWEAEQGAE
jgi:hypothetical protein